jgi:hypothetical protein
MNDYSIASPTLSISQRYSPMMVQNESTERSTIDKSHNSSKSRVINDIYVSQTLSSTQQPDDEPNAFEESQKLSLNFNRKRKLHENSSSSITSIKQSARLAAKRTQLV